MIKTVQVSSSGGKLELVREEDPEPIGHRGIYRNWPITDNKKSLQFPGSLSNLLLTISQQDIRKWEKKGITSQVY